MSCQRIPSAHLVGDGATPLARVHTDTRTLQAGDLFVALKGERFDANAFLPKPRPAALPPPWRMVASRRRGCPALRCPTLGLRLAPWLQGGAPSSTCR